MKILLITALFLSCIVTATEKPAFVDLPNTDGGPLVSKLAAVDSETAKQLSETGAKACNNSCVSPFASILGKADGVIAYSNCQSTCIKPEYSFLNLKTKEITRHTTAPKNQQLVFVGVIYQCVEYARRWWMLNKGISFGSIDSAFEILYLTEAKNIYSNKTFPLARSINGSAKRPPQRGDLVVYAADRSNPLWRHGHVAVVVDVDLKAGEVFVAEENYNNKAFLNADKYSRKISLFKVGSNFTLLDVAPNSIGNPTGATISGWIYPLQ